MVISVRVRNGLTFVELLVVLAIISMLLALLLPAIQIARERAQETICKNNLYQLNLAVTQYVEVHKSLPQPIEMGRVGGWSVEILPFLEQGNLSDDLTTDLPVAQVSDSFLKPPSILRCPRRSAMDSLSEGTVWPAHYVLIPAGGRESFLLFDCPVGLGVPWLSSPEMAYNDVVQDRGPHHDGFFFSRGFQQGVSFMLNGIESR